MRAVRLSARCGQVNIHLAKLGIAEKFAIAPAQGGKLVSIRWGRKVHAEACVEDEKEAYEGPSKGEVAALRSAEAIQRQRDAELKESAEWLRPIPR